MIELIIALIAGMLAGMATGAMGASAVMIAAPLLVIFLNYHAYLAIGVALSTDVFSSSSSALIYYKNKKIRLKPALVLLTFALIGVVAGSYFSKDIASHDLSIATGAWVLIAGLLIILKKKREAPSASLTRKKDLFLSVLAGTVIGLIAGFLGAGGGLMIFFVLTFLLNYKSHYAVGTSVFLMIFIAFTGAVAHYIYMPFPLSVMLLAGLGGLTGGVISSKLANKVKEKTLKNIVGGVIAMLGVLLLLDNLFL